jgi:putative heme transporter
MEGELAPTRAGRQRHALLRYLVGVLIGFVVLLLLFGKRGEFAAAWRQLGSASPGWVALAIGAESLSLLAFAWLQHRVLQLSGTAIPMPGLFALALANDAIASTVPGEPAVSSAYRYRYYRRRGASAASAGWAIFSTLIALAIGMSLVLLLGVTVALAGSTSVASAGVTIVGLVIVVGAGAVLIRRDLVIGLAGAAVRGLRRVTGHPRDSLAARVQGTLARMREIPLSRRSTSGIVMIAAAVWFADFLCLVCSFRAVHSGIPWHGVLVAYGVAQVVGSLPVVPGGLGLIEGSLTVVLVAYGAGRIPAVSAVLAFRIVNFWVPIAIGWTSVALITRHLRRVGRVAQNRSDEPERGWPDGLTPDGPASVPAGD